MIWILIARETPLSSPGEAASLLRSARPLYRVSRDATLLSALETMLERREHLPAVTGEGGACRGNSDARGHYRRTPERRHRGIPVSRAGSGPFR